MKSVRQSLKVKQSCIRNTGRDRGQVNTNQKDDISGMVIQSQIKSSAKQISWAVFTSTWMRDETILSLSHESKVGGLSPSPGLHWPVWDHSYHCDAHVEGHCLHWRQYHCHGRTLGGLVDELLQTGWHQDAVQGIWLTSNSPTRAAGSQSAHMRLHSPGCHRLVHRRMWDKEEQMLQRQYKKQEHHPCLGG